MQKIIKIDKKDPQLRCLIIIEESCTFSFFLLLPRNYAETFLFVFVGKDKRRSFVCVTQIEFEWKFKNSSFLSYLKIILVF